MKAFFLPLLALVAWQCSVPKYHAHLVRVEYVRPPAVFFHHANGSTNWLQCTNVEHVYIDVACTESNEQFCVGASTIQQYYLLTDNQTN